MIRILFQGDSITDGNRYKDPNSRWDLNHQIGHCYVFNIVGNLGRRFPGKYTFINRGISGNRIVDVYARIKKDIINLNPSVMSILIGVNDVWHEINYQNGIETPKFELLYSMLIEEVKEALPDIKIMILEPFVLRGTATEESFDYFNTECKKRAAVARRIAEEHGLTFIPLQEDFDRLCENAPESHWLRDGVHPTPFGHRMIADKWLAAYRAL